MHTSLWLRAASLSLLTAVGTACGDGSSSMDTTAAGNPQTQREPVTPAPPAAMPMGNASVPPANMPVAMTPPSGTGGTSGGSETPVGPVGIAGGTGQGPSGTSGGSVPDAGAQPSPEPTPVQPPPPAAFSPCPSDGTPCRIMPLGDSITFGIGSSGGGYRVELFRQAVADQHDITFVGVVGPGGGSNTPNGPTMVGGQAFPRSHEGFSGFTISGGGAGSLAGLVDAAIAQTDPNIVLLMIGTNDVNGNIDVANAPNRL